ncbi:hypothetical protein [Pseudomonas caspiana]|uniref:Uncharacterized protein n=1 Tax=Pseudomonas caspiana TaxID=1451454 RepID=A0A1Y3P594_9PSED|nr:hypothetical protein [Pseudomonas caspiana]OUM73701.1 hypothetical protein AUC60_11525 [Pseudomonas caspiana]
MKQWTISYLDKDGVQQSQVMESDHRPSDEEVARRLRHILVPVADELDMNDLDGRIAEPTAKSLKEHNAVQIISIKEAS